MGPYISVTGRYAEGRNIIGYNVVNLQTGESGGVDANTLYNMVKEGVVTNVTAQMYQGKPIFKGKDGMELKELPVVQLNGAKIKKGVNREEFDKGRFTAMRIYRLGNKNVAVKVHDKVGNIGILSMPEFNQVALDGAVSNVKASRNGDSVVIRYDKELPKSEVRYSTDTLRWWNTSPFGIELQKSILGNAVTPEMLNYRCKEPASMRTDELMAITHNLMLMLSDEVDLSGAKESLKTPELRRAIVKKYLSSLHVREVWRVLDYCETMLSIAKEMGVTREQLKGTKKTGSGFKEEDANARKSRIGYREVK